MSRRNIADEIKKQTDKILRQQRLNPNVNTVLISDPSNPGAPPQISNPGLDLAKHKTADDHLNYLTKGRHDLLDHSNLPGIPAEEEFTEEAHNLLDHAGLPGVGGGGVGAFTELTDAPASYEGKAGKVVSVNETETGLEFTTPSSGASGSFDFGSITEEASYSWDCGGIV